MAGLSHGDSNSSYTDIDFALYPLTQNRLMVYESGAFRFIDTYSAGDRLRVAVESGVVRYRRNGALVYQSTTAPVFPLVLDSSIYRTGATIVNAVISGTFLPPQAPVANPGGPYTAGTGLSLQLDGSGSSDADGTIVDYIWDFGDGTTGSGMSPTHTYASAGSYVVHLTVTDNDGSSNTATTSVLVETVEEVVWTNVVGATAVGNDLTKTAPDGWGNAGAISKRALAGDGFVEFTAPASGYWMAGLSRGDNNQFDNDIDFALYPLSQARLMIYEAGIYQATATYSAGDHLRVAVESGIVRYRRNGTLIYQSSKPPVYPLVLDSSIYSSGAVIKDAVISGAFLPPQAPMAHPGGPYTAGTGLPLQLDGSGSSDFDGSIVSYAWNFGDGATGDGPMPTHVYAVADTYFISLKVTDNDGLSHTATTSVVVEALEEVVWTHVVGATASGNDLTKTAPDGWGNAGAISGRSLAGDGFVEFTADASAFWMAGLSRGDNNQTESDIDFALYALTSNRLMVYESGVFRFIATYSAGDRLRVAVESGVVRYRRNGTLIYQSTVAPVYPLVLDSSIYRSGTTIKDAVLSGALQ
jgi:PKD repeat protein